MKKDERVVPGMVGDCLLMPLTAANLRINGGDPRTLQEHEIHWSDAGIDTIEAVGDTGAWVLLARFKGDGASTPPTMPDDNAMIVAPSVYRLVFENHRARVAWVTTRPGEKIGMHSHPAPVFRYPMVRSMARSISPDGSIRDITPVSGTAFWREEPSMYAMRCRSNPS